MTALRILAAGPLTTVQDLGRPTFQDRGVPGAGVMDTEALRLGNALVGNPEGNAGLEITLGGFRAEITGSLHFAVTGMTPAIRLNGRPVTSWSRLTALPGDVIEIDAGRPDPVNGTAFAGLRQYFCPAGGIDVPVVLGSRSTYLRGGFGGYHGRVLKNGDVVPIGTAPDRITDPAVLLPELRPAYSEAPTLRAVPGPQEDALSPESTELLFGAEFTVSARSDRMGILLDGPTLTHRAGPDILSDGVAFGSIQVPGSGKPFVLMADRPTTGGYGKPATVISVDLPLLAQLGPGHRLRFRAVSVDEAREVHLKRRFRLERWKKGQA